MSELNNYDFVSDFKDEVAIIIKDGLYGLISQYGTEILSPRYNYIAEFNKGIAEFCTLTTKNNIDGSSTQSLCWGILNTHGEILVHPLYESIKKSYTSNEYFLVAKKVLVNTSQIQYKTFTGKVNRKGQLIIEHPNGKVSYMPTKYDWQDFFINGRSKVYSNGNIGYVNDDLKQLIKIAIGKDKTYLTITLPEEFDWGYDSSYPYFIVEKKGKKGIYSYFENKLIVPTKYDSIEFLSECDQFFCKYDINKNIRQKDFFLVNFMI